MLENMLDYIRISLYALLIVIGLFLFQTWQKEHPKITLAQTTATVSSHYVPVPDRTNSVSQTSTPPPHSLTPPPAVDETTSQGKLVKITTDVFQASIDTKGGDLVNLQLRQYPETLHSQTPFVLLNDDPQTRYIAESGLLSTIGPDTNQHQGIYETSQTQYALQPDQNQLIVKLLWHKNNIDVIKTFTFTRNSYEIKVRYDIVNQSQKPFEANLYMQLMRTNTPPAGTGGLVNLATYFGAAISSEQKPFQKITFKDMQSSVLNQEIKGGWAAMIQHYFISAWVPPAKMDSTYYSRTTSNDLYVIGMVSNKPLIVAPGTKAATEAKLYAGPSIADYLEKTAPGLKLTIDYGWFWFISGIIFWMMQKIYDVIGNWGWSIVLVTVVIKLLFFQLSAKSYRSMSALKKLQPKIEKLKEQFGDDKQKITQATLELYRKEKVNPMSGCLPILIQIPVFIALYWVLVESVQLRQAPFILWIHDLSQPDPYYVLPVLMGLSMFLQQRLSPPPPDPMQAKIMMFMPIVFTVLFANFPAGLMLYWFVNNTLSFLQQWYVMKKIKA